MDNIQDCIASVKSWMQKNMLKLNDSKTEFIIFGSPYFLKQLDSPSLNVGTSEIEPSSKVRNLGAIFDKHLSMEAFVLDKIKNSLFYLRNIRRIRYCLDKDSTKTLVHAFVISRLDYANSLLYGCNSDLLHKLQVVQNYAAKLILQASRMDRATPLLKELHWLPIERRICFKILLIVHKCLNGKGPSYLCDLLSLQQPVRVLRSNSSNQTLLQVNRTFNRYGDRAFSNYAPVLWNGLPSSLQDCNDTDRFRKDLKTYMFDRYYC